MRTEISFLLMCSSFSLVHSCLDLSIASQNFGRYFKSCMIASAIFALPVEFAAPSISSAADELAVPAIVNIDQPKVVLNEYIRSGSTGIEYYDYIIGDGPAAKFGDKVLYNYKGRLAGL